MQCSSPRSLLLPRSWSSTFSNNHKLNSLLRFHKDENPFEFPKKSNQKLLSLRFRIEIFRVSSSREGNISSWDEKPYELLPGGRKVYLDEQDIIAIVDPPKELVPLDPSSYNPAAYLWKKIADIPEDRRHRLLFLLNPRQISRIWEVAGTRYGDANLVKKIASSLLSLEENSISPLEENLILPEFWSCRTSGGPMPIAWMERFRKVIFCSKKGNTYGRIFPGGSILANVANSFGPLYFTVRQHKEVMATEQPCDLAYELGDGLLDLNDYPKGFPVPVKHPWPFNDQVVFYVRHVGPGVLVGQAWQEGKILEQLPNKLCNEILMVKDFEQHY